MIGKSSGKLGETSRCQPIAASVVPSAQSAQIDGQASIFIERPAAPVTPSVAALEVRAQLDNTKAESAGASITDDNPPGRLAYAIVETAAGVLKLTNSWMQTSLTARQSFLSGHTIRPAVSTLAASSSSPTRSPRRSKVSPTLSIKTRAAGVYTLETLLYTSSCFRSGIGTSTNETHVRHVFDNKTLMLGQKHLLLAPYNFF